MRKLDPHQVTAKRKIYNADGRYLLAMAPGTGKTIVATHTTHTPALVICRRDDFITWIEEMEADGLKPPKLIESGKAKLPETIHENECYAVTYDLVKNKRIMAWIKEQPFAQVDWDEFDYCKRWKSARTKANYKATRHIPRRLGMTGTAITQDPKDLFALCKLIDDGKTFGDSEWWFMRKYYIRQGHGWYLRRGAKEKIAKKLEDLLYYVHEDDVLDLPKEVRILKGAPMSGMQRRHYENFLENWETELADGTILEISYIISQMQKLKQIASGFFYDEDHVAHWLRCPKLDLLMRLMNEDLKKKEKVIVWCSHTAEIHKIAELFKKDGIRAVTFHGSNRKANDAAKQEFHKDRKVRAFIGQVDKGRGTNKLIVADTAIYYSNSLKVAARQQSKRRHRRRGSEIHDRVYTYDLCTEGTLDRKLRTGINAAMRLAHEILSGASPSRVLT